MAKGSRLPLTLLEGSFNINRVLLQIQSCGGGMGEQTKPVHSVPDVVDHAVKMEYLLWEIVVDWVINLIIFVLVLLYLQTCQKMGLISWASAVSTIPVTCLR